MKRSLILLLVVALLATMAPTIALAAENATLDYFDVAMPIVTGVLSRTENPNQPITHWRDNGGDGQLVWTHVDSADGKVDSTKLQIVWMTSDKDIVGFADQPDHKSFIQDDLRSDGKTPFPKLDGRSVGVATITGKAYWKNDNLAHDPQLLGTVSFKVEVKPWWENSVTIEDPYDTKEPNKEKTSQTHTYWLSSAKVLPKDCIRSVAEIPDHGKALEDRAHVHYEPQEQKGNTWAATYGVSELVWKSSDPDIATVDKHGRIWFTGEKIGTVTITATAKEEAAYPHTPKFATITYVIKQSTDPVEPADETFKTLYFTEDELGVRRGCNRNVVNIAKYLELFPKPSETYRGTTESPDRQDGNYGKADDIIWTSSNENLIWICRDPAHYVNAGGPNDIGKKGPNWHTCYVEVSRDAKPGDRVTITATSKNNPALSDTIVLLVVADDQRTVTFERTSVTVRQSEEVTVKVLDDWTAWQLWDDRHVTLTSLNPDIARARMDRAGVTIRGVEPGTTTVTLESAVHNFKASIDVTVVPRNGVKSVTVPERYQNITMPLYEVGEKAEVDDGMNTTTVHVNINPSNAWYRATWTSSDPSVAYVVYDGNADYGEARNAGNSAIVRAAGVGKCKITVTIDDGIKTFKRSMNITVVKAKATKLALNKTKATHYLIKGGDNTLQLIATDAKTDMEVPVTWTTSDKTIAKVNKAGLVTLKKEGTVKITATTKDGYKAEKSCTITVKKLPVKKIALGAKKANMKVGETAVVVYRISPAKAYNTGVTFKSSNKKVVSVDKYGVLTAKKAGKAEITITAKDGSGVTAKLTITVKGVADNANVDVIDVVEDDNLELTLDGIDGIDDLGNEDEVVLNANDVIELAID